MANQKIPKQSDREAQKADLMQRAQNILDSNDKESINALRMVLGALKNMLPGKEGGAA